MKGGHVHQIGTPDQIYNTPATAFVASFIGDMNFLRGRLTTASGGSGTVEVEGERIATRRCPPGLAPAPRPRPRAGLTVAVPDDWGRSDSTGCQPAPRPTLCWVGGRG